mmetsp:Transcript_33675/g.81109  ORF Transcript_33675/g.81109 Transcript_33675/m.81109 type:complete len:114 (+) Transcript_33675:473-814(+)
MYTKTVECVSQSSTPPEKTSSTRRNQPTKGGDLYWALSKFLYRSSPCYQTRTMKALRIWTQQSCGEMIEQRLKRKCGKPFEKARKSEECELKGFRCYVVKYRPTWRSWKIDLE